MRPSHSRRRVRKYSTAQVMVRKNAACSGTWLMAAAHHMYAVRVSGDAR